MNADLERDRRRWLDRVAAVVCVAAALIFAVTGLVALTVGYFAGWVVLALAGGFTAMATMFTTSAKVDE